MTGSGTTLGTTAWTAPSDGYGSGVASPQGDRSDEVLGLPPARRGEQPRVVEPDPAPGDRPVLQPHGRRMTFLQALAAKPDVVDDDLALHVIDDPVFAAELAVWIAQVHGENLRQALTAAGFGDKLDHSEDCRCSGCVEYVA